jgi:DNA-binding NarL/FixJ family response regulator
MRMKSILLVDDHNLFRQVLAVVLKHRTDFKENIQAGSLAEARQILADRDGRFDLAIVDLDLPEGGATVLIHKLHEFEVPVLALTVGQSLEGCTRALRAGANEVLNMSSGEEIVGVVSRLISE